MNSHLPDHVIFHHILPRLPTESLLRFRYVCKSWRSFISDPFLSSLRRSLSPTTDHLLFVSPYSGTASDKPNVFSAPLLPGQDGVVSPPPCPTCVATIPHPHASKVAAQCVNGLLCLHPKNWPPSEFFAYICNPTTGQTITLPDDSSITRTEFDASTHFGYDPTRDEFKVLRLLIYNDGSHELKIFTIGDANNNSWRLVNAAIPISPTNWFWDNKRGVCVNGAIHWRYSSIILAFDLRSEQFRTMNIPEGYIYRDIPMPHHKFPDLVELGGCLTLVGYLDDDVLSLTMLKDYENQEWIQKRIKIPSEFGVQGRQHFPLCGVPKTEEILILPYFIPKLVRGIFHDLETMISRRAVIMEMSYPLWPDQKSGYADIFFYQENFIYLS